jgi:hypothetical protein
MTDLDREIDAALRRLRAPAPPDLADRVIASAPRRRVSSWKVAAAAASITVAAAVGYVATRPGALDEAVRPVNVHGIDEGVEAAAPAREEAPTEEADAPARTRPAAPPTPAVQFAPAAAEAPAPPPPDEVEPAAAGIPAAAAPAPKTDVRIIRREAAPAPYRMAEVAAAETAAADTPASPVDDTPESPARR